MKIEVGKFYKTRDGRKVRIYAIEEKGEHPIHGAVFDGHIWISTSFTIIGIFHAHNIDSDSDIVSEWQEPLGFDWDCLPKWADKYISMDNIGRWYCFDGKPYAVRYGWIGFKWISQIEDSFYPKNFNGNWKDSLFKNPKYKD